jgi:periodic tryptophan protein 2
MLHRQYKNVQSGDITSIDWSPDSRFIMTGSRDLTAKIINIHKINNYIPFTFTGHKSKIIKCFFSDDMNLFYTLTKDGYLFVW